MAVNERTEYGTPVVDVANFILGHCSMGVASELGEEEHLRILCEALQNAPGVLLYYLSDATENELKSRH